MKTVQITDGLSAIWSPINQAYFIMFMDQQVLAIKESLIQVDDWLIDHNMGGKCIDKKRAMLFA